MPFESGCELNGQDTARRRLVSIDHRRLIIRAVELALDRNVDFADAYLAFQATERGEWVCTFDESDFRRLPVEWMAPE
jgi:predicted nucleic acid-binding protein